MRPMAMFPRELRVAHLAQLRRDCLARGVPANGQFRESAAPKGWRKVPLPDAGVAYLDPTGLKVVVTDEALPSGETERLISVSRPGRRPARADLDRVLALFAADCTDLVGEVSPSDTNPHLIYVAFRRGGGAPPEERDDGAWVELLPTALELSFWAVYSPPASQAWGLSMMGARALADRVVGRAAGTDLGAALDALAAAITAARGAADTLERVPRSARALLAAFDRAHPFGAWPPPDAAAAAVECVRYTLATAAGQIECAPRVAEAATVALAAASPFAVLAPDVAWDEGEAIAAEQLRAVYRIMVAKFRELDRAAATVQAPK